MWGHKAGREHFRFQLSHMVSLSLVIKISRQEYEHVEVALSPNCAQPLDFEMGSILSLNLSFVDLVRLASQ